MNHHKKIAVLFGGPSSEYEVSLKTGAQVVANLDRTRYETTPILIGREGSWSLSPEEVGKRFDVAFIAMHGAYGEDGTIQSILDDVRIPYTGSAALPSALAMNKHASLTLFKDAGLQVPHTELIGKSEWMRDPAKAVRHIRWHIERPWVIKPNRDGSSVGVAIVQDPHDLPAVLLKSFERSREVIVQPYIRGREFTCGVLDRGFPASLHALPPTEIVPKLGAFFDYASKYEADGSLEITPAKIPELWTREIQRIALTAHRLLGCRGMSRTDMILSSSPHCAPTVLETNTIPGMTETSLLPQAAVAAGISFPELLDRIIEAALNR